MTVKVLPKISWQKALTASVVIHGAVFGLLAFAYGSGQTAGGEGMISLDIGGPAGEAGGFGEVQKEGRMGNAGAGGDGARQHAKERKLENADSTMEKPVVKTEGEALPAPPLNRVKPRKALNRIRLEMCLQNLNLFSKQRSQNR